MEKLKVSEDGRYIAREDGSPFFYLGGTAWEIFHRMRREEADRYLENRARKGFTVIQAVVLAEHDGLREPNPYGETPLVDLDPTKPNDGYFQHVDYIVEKAGSLGLHVGMLPTWGDKVTKRWGVGPEVFDEKNAFVYGRFLGERYRDASVIWILGGDRSPEGAEAVWRAMARGLKEGDGGTHLATCHCAGGPDKRGSSHFFHDDDWLDVNMAYSGHSWAYPSHELILHDRAMTPPKPTFDGEPRYENHPYIGDGSGIYRNRKMWDGVTRAGSHQIRQAAYWAMLAGACGHTYGCHDIWQFYDEDRSPVTHANTYWHRAIHFEGSYQMGLMRRFFESRPWQTLVPDDALVTDGQGEGQDHVQAALSADRSSLLAYASRGAPFSVDVGQVSGRKVAAHWFKPHDGTWTAIGEFGEGGAKRAATRFVPPHRGAISDWVLVLDDARRAYPTEAISIEGVPKGITEADAAGS